MLKRLICSVWMLICTCCLFAQGAGWSIHPYEDRYFVENIGQYDAVEGEPVLCGVDNLGTEILYLQTGFVYRHRQAQAEPTYVLAPLDEPDNEAEDHTRLVYDTLSISAHWEGISASEYELLDPKTPLFHYAKNGRQLVGAHSYGRLLQPDLYPGIDLAYTFHPSEGMKYDFTVHPGGDPARIGLTYSGMDQTYLDSEGNLHVKLGAAELIDHAPTAYLQESGLPVAVQFVLSGNTVRFDVADYDAAQTLVIDPWIINPGFTAQGKVFDVGWDCSGNVYAFGGNGPWKVKKFNSAGTLIWNYNTSHTAWYGDLVIDDLGNSYLMEGCCNGNREKLNSAGVVQWTVNNGVYEFWRMAFTCDYSKLTLANAYSGGGIAPTQSLSTVNFATGALTGGVTISGSEPRSLTGSLSGNYYVLTSVGNELLARNATYAPVYNVGNGYSLLYNGPLYSNGTNTTQGQNGIAVYSTFIFTSNGATVMKRNIATGALLASAVIPGGVAEQFSGVTVDNCGNVFVGGNNNVYQYDVNLNPIATIAVGAAVYDVTINGSSQLLVAGNGILASQNAPCVAVCPTCVILPEGLMDWNVTLTEANDVRLQWSLERPEDYASFTVERSADAMHFVELRLVDAGRANYSILDESPLQGTAWYRLAMLDREGTVSYSPIRQVDRSVAPQNIAVFPNPASDRLQVRLQQASNGPLLLQVFDAQGKMCLQEEVQGEEAAEQVELDIARLHAGIFTLRLVGSASGTAKFCKVDGE